MQPLVLPSTARRYGDVTPEKADGATYTPSLLARFVADHVVENAGLSGRTSLTVLDPAIGNGALVIALLSALEGRTQATINVRGFDTNASALVEAARQIGAAYPSVRLELTHGSFLEFVLENGDRSTPTLFLSENPEIFDLIIANPPYVRTQVMGQDQARRLAATFGLTGRVDLYQAFLLGIAQVLASDGTAGIIVSNRFMTTKGGAALRTALRRQLSLRQVWDLGDTKLFDAAVLPAVITARGRAVPSDAPPTFASIYQAQGSASSRATNPIDALKLEGLVEVEDGRKFNVQHGVLDHPDVEGGIWRIRSPSGDEWQAAVSRRTWKIFGEVGKIRVGVKTCADKVFIRRDWDSALSAKKPELLRRLTTHHVAGRFRSIELTNPYEILYPHEIVSGQRRAVRLDEHPKSREYLETHRTALERRTYVLEAGRQWYELWVPQDPITWVLPKLVFRDISERPTFWMDLEGSVVNGDCYWLVANHQRDNDLLWLAAGIANSTFSEEFYDRRFNNKLYAGRRRYITQYVEQFPLPDPELPTSREIISFSKRIYAANHSQEVMAMQNALDERVWRAFGLDFKKI